MMPAGAKAPATESNWGRLGVSFACLAESLRMGRPSGCCSLSRLAVADRNSRRWSLGVDSRTGKQTGCGWWELPVGEYSSLQDTGAEGPPTFLAWLPTGFLYYHAMVVPKLWVLSRPGKCMQGWRGAVNPT